MHNNNINTTNQYDQIVKCLECGAGFVMTLSEREWYSTHLLNIPKRCRECRKKRRGAEVRDVQ